MWDSVRYWPQVSELRNSEWSQAWNDALANDNKKPSPPSYHHLL